MAAPAFVQAGAGVAILTGTGTVSMTGASAGNLILVHLVTRGLSEDWSAFSNIVNITTLPGVPNDIESIQTGLDIGAPSSKMGLFVGRATGSGTVSADASLGASGEDMFLRMYEFSGEFDGATEATVFENGAGVIDFNNATASTTVNAEPVITNGNDRLALQFVALDSNQAVGSFTGESGGDWTEAVAEYAPATGATATLQLQTASMPSAGTITGGSITISSAGWGVVSTAIIPLAGQVLLPDADIVTTGWTATPLFSKLNDASDATIITSTAA